LAFKNGKEKREIGKRYQGKIGGILMDTILMRRKYIDLVSGNRLNKIKKLERLMRDKEEHVIAAQIDLVNYIRDLEEIRTEYQVARIDTPEFAEIKGIEFDRLMTHPDIEGLLIDENYITIFTGPIYIEYHNKVYDIGKFKIVLSINPRNFIVKMQNLTRSLNGTAHPHVYENGDPCLGNIQECLPQMIAGYQYAAAISVCIQYLKSVNEDGGHRSKITNWPLKKAKKEEENDKK